MFGLILLSVLFIIPLILLFPDEITEEEESQYTWKDNQ